MKETLTIAIAQINVTVGAIEKNTDKIIRTLEEAQNDHHADIVIFPEMVVTGYPPEDLLYRASLYERVNKALTSIKHHKNLPTSIIGYPEKVNNSIYNTASVIQQGSIIHSYQKQKLPNYSVFDEKRYFTAGSKTSTFQVKGINISLLICEDLWYPNLIHDAKQYGAELIIAINASPFDTNKESSRKDMIKNYAQTYQLPLIYVNLVGGQDELVFDGGSLVVDQQSNIIHESPYFEEAITSIPLTINSNNHITWQAESILPSLPIEQKIYDALVLGVKDYAYKNGFKSAVLGLSGGIDSALSLAIACDALGSDHVTAIMMPSEFTSTLSFDCAEQQVQLLNVSYNTIPINAINDQFVLSLAPAFQEYTSDTTEENIQARIRGVLLMALSNKTGSILLTTGNRSELAVGYSTLYGDMAGGFCVLKDIPKTLVYRLAHYRNSLSLAIPQAVIDRAPSAELNQNQTDQDTLPPYDILDDIIYRYIDLGESAAMIIKAGHKPEFVTKIIKLININEYKRRQSAPGIRISHYAFGKDRRYPITSHFYDGNQKSSS